MSPARLLGAGLAALACAPAAAFDANGVPIGASESEVRKHFPAAFCKPLEWSSRAAERRCDDAKVPFAGIEARITFYLKKDAVEGFEVRFESRDAERLVAELKTRYGKPFAEVREQIARPGKSPRELYKVRWEQGVQRAVMIAPMEKRRASLTVSRGDFEEEIYRVR